MQAPTSRCRCGSTRRHRRTIRSCAATSTYLLSKAGKSVVLVDKGRIATSESGHTTAHIVETTDADYRDNADVAIVGAGITAAGADGLRVGARAFLAANLDHLLGIQIAVDRLEAAIDGQLADERANQRDRC